MRGGLALFHGVREHGDGRDGPAESRLRQVGIDGEGAFIGAPGVDAAALLVADGPEAGPGVREVGPGRQRRLESRRRRGEVAAVEQQQAEVALRLDQTGLEAKGAPVGRLGLREPPLGPQQVAEVQAGFGIAGGAGDGPLVAGRGVRQAALAVADGAEIGPGVDVGRP